MYLPLTWKRMLALSMLSKEGNVRLLHVLSSIYTAANEKMQTIVPLLNSLREVTIDYPIIS